MKLQDQDILNAKQKRFRAAGIVLFAVSLGLLLVRVGTSLLYQALEGTMSEVALEISTDVIFTVAIQVIMLFAVPFLIYKLYLKQSAREIFFQSNYSKIDWKTCVIAFIIGVLALIVTMCVSVLWSNILLILFGYYNSSTSVMPETFNGWHLLLSLVLTAVLPGLCEEFVNRGIVLTALRNTFPFKITLLLGGVCFGLFHQHASQVFYTALMGIMLTYIVLTTKSIWPAVIVHFTNNAISVVLDFWGEYSFFGVNPNDGINWLFNSAMPLVFLAAGASLFGIFMLLKAMRKIQAKKFSNSFMNMMESGEVSDKTMEPMVTPNTTADVMRYKPCPRDYVFYIGALFITVVNTLFTFYWGTF